MEFCLSPCRNITTTTTSFIRIKYLLAALIIAFLAQPPPQFSADVYIQPIVAKRLNEDITWYGDRPRPRRHCVRWGPSSPKKGTDPQFSAHVYCGQTVAHLSYCWAVVSATLHLRACPKPLTQARADGRTLTVMSRTTTLLPNLKALLRHCTCPGYTSVCALYSVHAIFACRVYAYLNEP